MQLGARGHASSPSHGGLPQQGNLEAEFGVEIRASEHPGHPGHVTDTDYESGMLRSKIAELRKQLRDQRQAFDLSHPVDEYSSTPGIPAQGTITGAFPDGFTSFMQVTADWTIPVRIESIIACVPPGTTFAVAKLKDRWIPVYGGSATVTAPAFPPSGNVIQNTNTFPVIATITTFFASITDLHINGLEYFPVPVSFLIPAGGLVYFNWTVNSPTWTWVNANSALIVPQLVTISNVGVILNEDDDRLLLMTGAQTGGPTHFELMGFAHEIWGNA